MVYNTCKLTSMSETELFDTNAGAAHIAFVAAVAAVAVGGAIILLGVYNGYHDTKDQKK